MAERIRIDQNDIMVEGRLLREQRGLSGLLTRRDVPHVGGGRRYTGSLQDLQPLPTVIPERTDEHKQGPQWNPNMTKDDIRGF